MENSIQTTHLDILFQKLSIKINVTKQLRQEILRDLEQSNINISKQSIEELIKYILKQQKKYKLETVKQAKKKTMNVGIYTKLHEIRNQYILFK